MPGLREPEHTCPRANSDDIGLHLRNSYPQAAGGLVLGSHHVDRPQGARTVRSRLVLVTTARAPV